MLILIAGMWQLSKSRRNNEFWRKWSPDKCFCRLLFFACSDWQNGINSPIKSLMGLFAKTNFAARLDFSRFPPAIQRHSCVPINSSLVKSWTRHSGGVVREHKKRPIYKMDFLFWWKDPRSWGWGTEIILFFRGRRTTQFIIEGSACFKKNLPNMKIC